MRHERHRHCAKPPKTGTEGVKMMSGKTDEERLEKLSTQEKNQKNP